MVNTAFELRSDALAELARFVRTQTALLAALQSQFGTTNSCPLGLSPLPPTGTVTVAQEIWDFRRHGGGLLFEERATHRRVDVHTRVEEAEVFDAWRLSTYFGSLGNKGARLVAKATGVHGLGMANAVELLLRSLLDEGAIERDGDGFRLGASAGKAM